MQGQGCWFLPSYHPSLSLGSPEHCLLCGQSSLQPPSGRGGRGEGELEAGTLWHTHADFPSVWFCLFSSFAKMIRWSCEAAAKPGVDGMAAPALALSSSGILSPSYFCIWKRKSRRLMFLAASSLLHSTESMMGRGT